MGYTEVTLNKEWTIFGINYTAVDGTDLTLQNAGPYTEGMVKGNGTATADQIQTASGGYDIYYMSNGKNAKGGTVTGLDGKWAKSGTTTATDVTVPAGTAFWYKRNDAATPVTVKVAGGVSLLGSYDKQLTSTWRLIANPYPTALPLNDSIPYVAGMTKGNGTATADQIQIQTASGGYDIYYMSNGKNAKGGAVSGLEGKWAKSGTTTATDAAIPVGGGAWYKRATETDFDIRIVRPFNVE